MSYEETRIEAVFLKALEIQSPQERAAYLSQTCAGADDLRRRVERMLAAQPQLGSFLDQNAAAMVLTTDESALEGAGAQIGPYKLLEKIGEGGMGVVYLADQAEPVHRRVALKVIKPGMDSRQVIARFEAERQALALMDHPNIATVLDAGTTDSGRPYFVMELVKGQPITQYCDEHHLTPRQRLELLLPVCQAIQHAHQKGVIHRDVKPTNVLVAEYDQQPVPKVIDFGVAKAIGQSLTEKTMFTGLGQLVGTLEYMSPEQAKVNQLDIDTRSDIYSLGVLLYELLTGSTPFDKQRLRSAAFDEMLRIIREEEPPKPSTRLESSRHAPRVVAEDGTRSVPTSLASIAAQRHTEPAKLTKLVRGELDWIVMKALEKERTRRYETANDLALDLQRYLSDEPVQACPPSASYRFRKLAQRNKVALTTAAVVAAVMVLGTLASTWQAVRAMRAEYAERLARSGAEKASEQAARDRDRALLAGLQAQRRQYDAQLGQARASRRSGQVGQRFESLKSLIEAANVAAELKLDDSHFLQLRNEAIACLALTDLRISQTWADAPPDDSTGIAFTANLSDYASSDNRGNISIRRLADHQESMRFAGFGTPSRHLRFSPDEQFLATVYEGNRWQLWDTQQGAAFPQAPAPLSNIALDFSPDGHTLAVGESDGSILLYDGAKRQEVRRLTPGALPHFLRFHPQGNKLAICSKAACNLQIRDVETGRVTTTLVRPVGVICAGWSPSGKLLAVGCADGAVYVWDADANRLHKVLQGHRNEVVRVEFDPTGTLLASVAWDGTVRLWDAWSGRQSVSSAGAGWRTLRFSADGRRLGYARAGNKIGLWEVARGREWRTLYTHTGGAPSPAHRGPWRIDVSPDARLLASAGNDGVRLWDCNVGREVARLNIGWSRAALFHPSGDSLITDGSYLSRWPIRRDTSATGVGLAIGPPQILKLPEGTVASTVQLNCISQDGKSIVVRTNNDRAVLIDLASPTRQVVFQPHPSLCSADISPDGGWVVTGAKGGAVVKVWNAKTGDLERELPVATGGCAAFTPDGKWLVADSGEQYALWAAGSWKPGAAIACNREEMIDGAMASTRDGRMLAVGHSRHSVQLLDPATGRPWAMLESPDELAPSWLCFSPDGSQLAVASAGLGVIQLWDLRLIRQQLVEMKLDWKSPTYRPPSFLKDEKPMQVRVDFGALAVQQKRQAGDNTAAGPETWLDATILRPGPTLLAPLPGATLENGSADVSKSRVWEFKWTPIAGATRYDLMVTSAKGAGPRLDQLRLTKPEYRLEDKGYVIDANRLGWKWKVRALVQGVWTDWSDERCFDIAPLGDKQPPPPKK